MTTMTLNLHQEDTYLIDYITENHIDVSGLTINQFLELLEDAKDLHELRQAKQESDGNFISHADLMKEFDYDF